MLTRPCPICNTTEQSLFLESKDYSVSQEEFRIVTCAKCGFNFTNPIPLESEIGRYYKSDSYVSHSSSRKGLVNKLYHLVRWYSLRKKERLVRSLVQGRRLLDIGAGTGHFASLAKKKGWDVLGLEPDHDAREFAKKEHDLNVSDIVRLHELEAGSYDIVTMWHVLEHVYNLQKDAAKIASLIGDKGALIVAVPNLTSYDARYYGKYWAAYDLPIHLSHFRPEDITNLFAPLDLEIVKVLPMKFDSFYVSMLSEKYRNGSLFKAFLIGLKSNWLATDLKYSSQIYILRRKTH